MCAFLMYKMLTQTKRLVLYYQWIFHVVLIRGWQVWGLHGTVTPHCIASQKQHFWPSDSTCPYCCIVAVQERPSQCSFAVVFLLWQFAKRKGAGTGSADVCFNHTMEVVSPVMEHSCGSGLVNVGPLVQSFLVFKVISSLCIFFSIYFSAKQHAEVG